MRLDTFASLFPNVAVWVTFLAAFPCSGTMQEYKLIVFYMSKIEVKCVCEGTGFIAVAHNGGDGIEHIACGQHHPPFQDAPSVDELLAHIGKRTGTFFER